MSEWQPIETAPKDGTRILVWPRRMQHTGELRHTIVRWFVPKRGNPFWIGSDGSCKPTHWMHLPEPPK